MATSIMNRAREQQTARAPAFRPKDARQFAPQENHDAIDRIVAAGIKLMYSPEMADERRAAIESQEPVPQRLAINITGLMLTLDQSSKGGLPAGALFPAAIMLLNDAAEILTRAGQKVTEDDYNDAIHILYVQIGKKLGASDDQLMEAAQQASPESAAVLPPEDPGAQGLPGTPPTPPAAAADPAPEGV